MRNLVLVLVLVFAFAFVGCGDTCCQTPVTSSEEAPPPASSEVPKTPSVDEVPDGSTSTPEAPYSITFKLIKCDKREERHAVIPGPENSGECVDKVRITAVSSSPLDGLILGIRSPQEKAILGTPFQLVDDAGLYIATVTAWTGRGELIAVDETAIYDSGEHVACSGIRPFILENWEVKYEGVDESDYLPTGLCGVPGVF